MVTIASPFLLTYSNSHQNKTPELYLFEANHHHHQLCEELSVSINSSQGYCAEMDFAISLFTMAKWHSRKPIYKHANHFSTFSYTANSSQTISGRNTCFLFLFFQFFVFNIKIFGAIVLFAINYYHHSKGKIKKNLPNSPLNVAYSSCEKNIEGWMTCFSKRRPSSWKKRNKW